jgi:hypothetical protein
MTIFFFFYANILKFGYIYTLEKNIDASKDVELFFHHGWFQFILPLTIIFNHDSLFINHIWKILWSILCLRINS